MLGKFFCISDRSAKGTPARRQRSVTGLFICALLLTARPTVAEDWLQWGGPNGDFTVHVEGLAEKWPADGPKRLWKRPLGDGYSAILCKGSQLYTMYRDGKEEVVIALSAKTGETIWEHRYARAIWPEMRERYGLGPNATPSIVGNRIVSVGISGQLRCLDLATGKLLWQHDLPAEFGRRKRVEEYGYSNSPLHFDGRIIVHIGSDDASIIAFAPVDGSIVWKSDSGGVSYAPPTLTRLGGRDQFIFFSPEGVNGLDPATGETLWHFPMPFNNGNHLTPVVKCDENHLWVSSQFTSGGGRLLKISHRGKKWHANQVWFETKLRGSCWTAVRQGDYIYGSAGSHNTSFLACSNWRTGEIVWRQRGFHMAQCLYADGKLIFLDKQGKLVLAKVSPEGLELLGNIQMTEHVSWTLPTLVSTKLYLRDRKNIMAIELGKKQ